MPNQFSRTELLFGQEAMQKLAAARVAVFGVGGVGGYAVEALARSGVGALDLIDSDTISLTNINRQLLATHDSIGKSKVEVARQRILSINPACTVTTHQVFYLPETEAQFDFTRYDYIIDAIDTVSGKLALIVNAQKAGTPIICSMGAGNKLDPTAFRVADIYETSADALARVIRKECRKRGIAHLKVVYSQEEARRPLTEAQAPLCPPGAGRKDIPGSTAFVPSVAGLILAGEVIKDIAGIRG